MINETIQCITENQDDITDGESYSRNFERNKSRNKRSNETKWQRKKKEDRRAHRNNISELVELKTKKYENSIKTKINKTVPLDQSTEVYHPKENVSGNNSSITPRQVQKFKAFGIDSKREEGTGLVSFTSLNTIAVPMSIKTCLFYHV